MNEIKEYIECECGTELLQLVYDIDNESDEWNSLYISYYTCGQKGNHYSWKDRLRHIWYIIRKGTPFDDYITLNQKEIEKLRIFINSIK